MNRRAGFSLIEVVIAMAVFGLLIFVMLSLTMEMAHYERRLRIDFLKHPQIIAVIARMRRDVLDGFSNNPYGGPPVPGYSNNSKTLVIWNLNETGGLQTVVWDFSTPGEVVRRVYTPGDVRTWRARGVPPEFSADITSTTNPNGNGVVGVRIRALDTKGRVAIDQIFFPRTN